MQTGLMPTHRGDIVVTHSAETLSPYYLWRVDTFGQQAVGSSGYVAVASGLIDALQQTDTMIDEYPGSIFLRELDTFTWTRLSD